MVRVVVAAVVRVVQGVPCPVDEGKRFAGRAATNAAASATIIPIRRPGRPGQASIAPGITAITALSTSSITRMDGVRGEHQAQRARLQAHPRAEPGTKRVAGRERQATASRIVCPAVSPIAGT